MKRVGKNELSGISMETNDSDCKGRPLVEKKWTIKKSNLYGFLKCDVNKIDVFLKFLLTVFNT